MYESISVCTKINRKTNAFLSKRQHFFSQNEFHIFMNKVYFWLYIHFHTFIFHFNKHRAEISNNPLTPVPRIVTVLCPSFVGRLFKVDENRTLTAVAEQRSRTRRLWLYVCLQTDRSGARTGRERWNVRVHLNNPEGSQREFNIGAVIPRDAVTYYPEWSENLFVLRQVFPQREFFSL